MNPVENAEGVDIRQVPLIRQLEPGATQWQTIPGLTRGYGCSGIVVIARAGPFDWPGVPGCAAYSGPTPDAGPMNPSGVRLLSGRPGAGSMNLTKHYGRAVPESAVVGTLYLNHLTDLPIHTSSQQRENVCVPGWRLPKRR
jgi:hypothetical protein